MKRQASTLIALVALLITPMTVSISAQPAALMSAQIPFEFQINNKTMPAGRYTVSRTGAPNLLVIRCAGTPAQSDIVAIVAE